MVSGPEHAELRVELCGRLAEGDARELVVIIPRSGIEVAELLALIAALRPDWAEALGAGRIRACINDSIAGPHARVEASDRVALFPPVSGG